MIGILFVDKFDPKIIYTETELDRFCCVFPEAYRVWDWVITHVVQDFFVIARM